MRNLFLVLALILTLAACSAKDEAVEQPAPDNGAQQTAEQPAQQTEQAAKDTSKKDSADANVSWDKIPDGPYGVVEMKDGTKYIITKLIKLGPYYLYVDGELNGHSSTVISLTRFKDVLRWSTYTFKDEHTFTIDTAKGKHLKFEKARLFLGNDSNKTYSFYTVNDNYDTVVQEVNKADVTSIELKLTKPNP